jgi:hypothetical protein
MSVDGRPIINQLNNGLLSSTNAMPAKDSTSDNTGSFEIDRRLFKRTYQPPINFSVAQITRSIEQRRSPAIEHGFIIDGPKSVQQKKWIGGNRDASSITVNRRKASTGSTMTAPGPQSFFSKEKNSRIEALARCRGGGASVPPKVTGKIFNFDSNTPAPIVVDTSDYYRIVSAGNGALTNSFNTTGVVPGFYSYTPQNLVGTPIRNTVIGGFQRSYNVMTIDRTTGLTVNTTYDVFGTAGQDLALQNYLNGLSSTVIVVVATYDEPQRANSPNPLPAGLITAMQNCGASSNFGSSNGSPPGFITYRSSYILVGIPGCGTGNGLEKYRGLNIIGGDPNAFLDLRFSVLNGQYTYISG